MPTATNPNGNEFAAHASQVYAWAYRVLGRHHDALDVVQDVFVRWDQQCRTTTPAQSRAWLRRVTINRAIDLRRQAHQIAPRSTDDALPAPPASAEQRSDIDEAVVRDRLLVAMDRLSERQRLVLIAQTFDELTFAEIARDMQSSVSTVKTHYLRALRAVRARLDPMLNEEIHP